MARVPPFNPEHFQGAKRALYDTMSAGPRGELRIGPYTALIHRPDIAGPMQELGACLRFGEKLPARLRELAILVTSHFWSAEFEWEMHAPRALKEGISQDIIDAISNGETPPFSDPLEDLVHRFCRDVLETHEVGDDLYTRLDDEFGFETGLELVSVVGYYSLMGIVQNTYEIGSTKS